MLCHVIRSAALQMIIPSSESKKVNITLPWQRGGHVCRLTCHVFCQFHWGIRLLLCWWPLLFQAWYLIVVSEGLPFWSWYLIVVLETLPFQSLPKHRPPNQMVKVPSITNVRCIISDEEHLKNILRSSIMLNAWQLTPSKVLRTLPSSSASSCSLLYLFLWCTIDWCQKIWLTFSGAVAWAVKLLR